MDLLIGLGLFMAMFIGFYALLTIMNSKGGTGDLELEAENIANTFASDTTNFESGSRPISFIDSGRISETSLTALASGDYQEIRSAVGAKRDFCIFIEDEHGNFIPIEKRDISGSSTFAFGIGSEDATLGEGTTTRKCQEFKQP